MVSYTWGNCRGIELNLSIFFFYFLVIYLFFIVFLKSNIKYHALNNIPKLTIIVEGLDYDHHTPGLINLICF